MNSARSPWKPLICNFPSGYDNFLQMQSFEELERATAEIGVVNPGWSAHSSVENQISVTALNIYGVVAAVVAFFPAIFPSGLPAKYFMHARMAVLSRAWGSDGKAVLCPVADLFNHLNPTHVGISIRKGAAQTGDSNFSVVEVVLERAAAKGDEVFNGMITITFGHSCPETSTAAYSRDTCIPNFVLNFGTSLRIAIVGLRALIACRLRADGGAKQLLPRQKRSSVTEHLCRTLKLPGFADVDFNLNMRLTHKHGGCENAQRVF